MRPTTERALQARVIKYLKSLGHDCVFVKTTAAPPYSTAGVADLLICYKGRFIAIELKRPGTGRVTALQQQFLNRVIDARGQARVCRSVDEVKRIIDNISNQGDLAIQAETYAASFFKNA